MNDEELSHVEPVEIADSELMSLAELERRGLEALRPDAAGALVLLNLECNAVAIAAGVDALNRDGGRAWCGLAARLVAKHGPEAVVHRVRHALELAIAALVPELVRTAGADASVTRDELMRRARTLGEATALALVSDAEA